MSTLIKRTLHSAYTEEKTERRVIIDGPMLRQLALLGVPRKLLAATPNESLIDVTSPDTELAEHLRRL